MSLEHFSPLHPSQLEWKAMNILIGVAATVAAGSGVDVGRSWHSP